MYKFYFNLAGFNFLLYFEDIQLFKEFKKKYKSFLTKECHNPLLILSIRIDERNNSNNHLVKNNNKIDISVSKNRNSDQNILILELNWKIKVAIASELSKYNFSLMHASGLSKNNDFFIFTGASGAGKSTISRIAEENNYLKSCDDSVLIKVDNDDICVYSTPFIEKEKKYYKKMKWKLNSIFFIEQSSNDYKKRILKVESIKKIISNTYLHTDIQENMMIANNFLLAQKIAKKIPCYELFFTKSNNFLKIVMDN